MSGIASCWGFGHIFSLTMAKKTKKQKKRKNRETTSPFKFSIPKEAVGPLWLGASFILLMAMFSFAWGDATNWSLGLAGYGIGWVNSALFGLNGYLVIIFLSWIGWTRLIQKPNPSYLKKGLYFCTLLISLGIFLSMAEEQFPLFAQTIRKTFFTQSLQQKLSMHIGGAPFYYLYKDLPTLNFSVTINALGVALLFGSLALFSLIGLFQIDPKKALPYLASCRDWLKKLSFPLPKASIRQVLVRICEQNSKQQVLEINPEANLRVRPTIKSKPFETVKEEPLRIPPPPVPPPSPEISKMVRREQALAAQRIINGDLTGFKIPNTTFLTNPKRVDQSLVRKDLKRRAEVLEETLLSFGIEAKVGEINCGPTITSFEVHPAIGVKVQKIKSLESDIALNLEAKSIRILAPIPGKAAIGIEVPNPHPQEVSFKELLSAYQQSGKKFHIPLLLGKTVSGEYVMSDLAKMPHMIIAGATGSGKSVCINTIVMSILMNAKPDEIKLIMVDPKKVELTPYTKLPHMLAPVITEPQGASAAMHWLVKEMESRYEILKLVGLRNIASFNERKVSKDFEESLGKEIPEKMHYIVAIVDELADLMMVSSNDIETYIARIAQMARAVGIHLILATQRPSREVITGLIKANFPTRISFKVASRVNSQIVLDEVGAESLLGNGDMLFLPPGSSHLMRAQGAFIRDEDINAAVRYICQQAPPNYVIESFDNMDAVQSLHANGAYTPQDPLYEQALEVVMNMQNASTTFLQRKLKVGYARAASLIDELEGQGVIGPADGAKPRKILVGGSDEE